MIAFLVSRVALFQVDFPNVDDSSQRNDAVEYESKVEETASISHPQCNAIGYILDDAESGAFPFVLDMVKMRLRPIYVLSKIQ